MSILIRNGTVVNATGAYPADVLVEGERIAALAAPDSGLAQQWASGAERVIDAAGKYVVPGGIDGHTHMEMPFGGTFSADTFETGTIAAAWGGTTTMNFAVQRRFPAAAPGQQHAGRGSAHRLRVPHIAGRQHRHSRRWRPSTRAQPFKMFTFPGAFSHDGQILRAMQRRRGKPA
jgi:dihydropyrimidinase